MKKWLPYLIAAVLGIGVAVLAFGPGLTGSSHKKERTERRKKLEEGEAADKSQTKGFGASKDGAGPVDDGTKPAPEEFRAPNKAEIEQKAKLARPLNQHFAYVSAFWNRAAQLAGPGSSDLSRECSTMSRYLRDQSNLPDSELNTEAVVKKELELVEKLRKEAPPSEELTGVLDYIQESGQAVLDGKDPTTVLKPTAKKAAAAGK